MAYINMDALETGFEIVSKLLVSEDVGDLKNGELFRKFVVNTEVEESVEFICKQLGLSVFKSIEGNELYLSPGVDNKIFGYTNDELKRKLGLGNNARLYTAYFIIMTIITLFYRESALDASVSYLTIGKIIEEVGAKFDALVKREDLEEVSQQYSYNFSDIAKAWEQMVLKRDEDDLTNRGFKDKISAVNTVCGFLRDERLLLMEDYRIVPTNRFKSIIYHYFEDGANKSEILDFMRSL